MHIPFHKKKKSYVKKAINVPYADSSEVSYTTTEGHHGHHPPWLGISFWITTGGATHPLHSTGKQLHQD